MISGTINEQVKSGNVQENMGGLMVGIFNGTPVAVNPTNEELSKLLNFELDSSRPEVNYLRQNDDGSTTSTISMWVRDNDHGKLYNNRFYLENKNRESTNNPGSWQYINSVGGCTWSKDPDNLPTWFTNNQTYRKVYKGEEELHEFMRAWLSRLLEDDPNAKILLDFDKLIQGDMSEIRDTIKRFNKESLCDMATIRKVVKDGETKMYQSAYSKKFLPGHYIKFVKEGKCTGSLWTNFTSQVTNKQFPMKDEYSLKYITPFNMAIASTERAVISNPDEDKY